MNRILKHPNTFARPPRSAIDDGFTKYPPVSGYADLRQAISEKFNRENGFDFTPDQIVVSTGAKQSIANVMLVLVDPGDEVILPSPYWVSYREIIKLAQGKQVTIPSSVENNFKITPEQLEQPSRRTRACFVILLPAILPARFTPGMN